MFKHSFCQWLAISFLAALTAACGGGGGSGGSNSGTAAPASTTSSPSSSPSSSPTASASSPSVSRSVRLSWTIPTTRADGSALAASAIAGYRLFYTREDSAPSDDIIVAIDSGVTTSTAITLAALGTYTFAITAIDMSGAESALSAPASITID